MTGLLHFYFFLQMEDKLSFQLSGIILAFILSITVSSLAYKLKFLTRSGTIAAGIQAFIIFSLGSWKWTIPIFTFFFFSSLLSKLRQKNNSAVDTFFEKSGQRDYMQVIANGGFAALLVIVNFFVKSELIYYAFVSSLASVCSDTWATEIGTLRRTKTYSILTFKEIKQGVSGGVSPAGFAGAFAGALIVALSSLFWIEANSLIIIFLILFSGFSASIIDSILGAKMQVQYACVQCGIITEKFFHCGKPAAKVKGLKWMNNDAVNLVSGIAGGLIGFCLTEVILI